MTQTTRRLREILVGAYDTWDGHNSVFILDDQQATNCGLLTEELPGPFPEPELKFLKGKLRLVMPYEGRASLVLYDAAGRLAARLFEGHLNSGQYEFKLPRLRPGAYQVLLRFPGGSLVKRAVLD